MYINALVRTTNGKGLVYIACGDAVKLDNIKSGERLSAIYRGDVVLSASVLEAFRLWPAFNAGLRL